MTGSIYIRIAGVLLMSISIAGSALATGTVAEALVVEQSRPEFPKSEIMRAREGWVVISVDVDVGGEVRDAHVLESSGSEDFDAAALRAVKKWRYLPGKPGQASALFNFVFERNHPQVRRKFFSRNAKVHKAIDAGNLADADARLKAIREDYDLNPFELAYSFITEGRLAGIRDDSNEQLRCFRRALINEGRWLDREKYLELLYATIVLELQQQDYASAVRDYAFLTETGPGRELAEGLEGPMEAAALALSAPGQNSLPYADADSILTVVHEPLKTPRMPSPPADRPPSRPKPPPPKSR